MSYEIHKLTYSEGRPYRYRITDAAGDVCYEAEPTGIFLPDPNRLVTLLDTEQHPVGRIEPSPSPPWQWTREFKLLVGEEEELCAMIEERWTLVNRILLQLPSYSIQIGDQEYTARGTRYGERFYEVFQPPTEEESIEDEELSEEEIPEKLASQARSRWGEKVGEVLRPPAGANYVVKAEGAALRQAPLVLAALAILADMHLHGE
ncbi:MAG: hypothetical protein PVH62_04035 [Anaerolineae bacterium]|jgi:hypothetical protein